MKASRRAGLSFLACSCLAGLAFSQTTFRVSVGPGGIQANGDSIVGGLSPDGRTVVFLSSATNLVAGDTNGVVDVFVHDRQTGLTTRVSVDSAGLQANGPSGNDISSAPAISADGRRVAFESAASNLVPGDTNGTWDVFVHDRSTGSTVRVSVSTAGEQGNGWSAGAPGLDISDDGNVVAFSSLASNLVPDDTIYFNDIFVHDLVTGITSRVSVDSSGNGGSAGSESPKLSYDGRFVAFESDASNLVPGDTNVSDDVFVHDRATGTTRRVSVSSSGGQGNSWSYGASISADGRFVAFGSNASNLISGDVNNYQDVFVRDLVSNTTVLASAQPNGGPLYGISARPSISADGRFVAYGHGLYYINLCDRLTLETVLVSVNLAGSDPNGSCWGSTIPADGTAVSFVSRASDLVPGDTNNAFDVFVRDFGEPPVVYSCRGDGSGSPCPCGNSGSAGRGCENSAGTGGAKLDASGSSSVSADSLVLTATGELPSALSLFVQGNARTPSPVIYGDGLRCVGGVLKRLYARNASAGTVVAPQGNDPSVGSPGTELEFAL